MARSPLDPDVVAELEEVSGDPGFVDILLEGLCEDVAVAQVQMPRLLADDLDGAMSLAHKLKSGAGAVGALRLQEAFAEINRSPHDGEVHAARSALPELLAALDELLCFAAGKQAA